MVCITVLSRRHRRCRSRIQPHIDTLRLGQIDALSGQLEQSRQQIRRLDLEIELLAKMARVPPARRPKRTHFWKPAKILRGMYARCRLLFDRQGTLKTPSPCSNEELSSESGRQCATCSAERGYKISRPIWRKGL